MKLILAIVNDDDAVSVSSALNKAGISATKLATTGGFLKAGNTTFLIGLEDQRVEGARRDHRQPRAQAHPDGAGRLSLWQLQQHGHASGNHGGRGDRLCARRGAV